MSSTRKVVIVVSCLVLALVLAGALMVALLFATLSGSEPDVEKNSVLVLKVEGMLPDYAGEDYLTSRIFGQQQQSLTSLLTQIRKAKNDKRISAVLFDVGFIGGGWAKADEIRDAIADFRTSGKPAYAYMELGSDKEYYVATACDRVYVAPVGDLFINGLAAEVMFFKGSLDKLGVQMDFFQIGKYKNAPEQYTRTDMSEGHRETINSILDDQFNRYVETVARSRRKSVEDVRTLIDNAPINARQAAGAGLIDGANYRDEVENELKKRLGYKESGKLSIVKGSDYRRIAPESVGLNEGERIAIVFASGEIGSGDSDNGSFGSQSAGSDTLVKALNDARDDASVRAIVLRVDSPGGSIYPSDLIWHAVELAKAKKPVVVSMGDMGASGGYYIAANANRIIAQPSTLTGSIGVFAGKPVVKGFYDWIGVSSEYVLRGQNAGLFRETEPFSESERRRFEETIRDFYYNQFLPKVAKGRNRNVEYVDSVAQGRVWTGAQAKQNGLVDEIGGLDRAVEVARELAEIPAEKGVRRVVYPIPRTFLQQIFGGNDDEAVTADAKARQQQQAFINSLPQDMQRAFRYAAMFDRMKRGEIMARVPFELEMK